MYFACKCGHLVWTAAVQSALQAELQKGGTAGGGAASRHADISFGSMQVSGFGPFKEVQVCILVWLAGSHSRLPLC